MTKEIAIKLFEQEQLRFVCKVEDEKWYFSIIDIISILTGHPAHHGARNCFKAKQEKGL